MSTINNNSIAPSPTSTTAAAAPVARTQLAPAPARVVAPAVAGDSMGYSNAEAFRILMRAGQTGRDLAAKMRTAANKDETASKQAGVGHMAAQIKGEQLSAMTGLASKVAGAGVSGGAGYKGTKLRGDTNDDRRAMGAGLDSAAQGGVLGNVVTSAHDLGDKLSGGAYQADQAKLAGKAQEVETSLATQRKDSAAAGVTQADKVVDSALELAKDMRSRIAEVISKLTG